MSQQLFGKRNSIGEPVTINGMPYTVVGKIRKKDQDSNYSGPDNNKVFVPFAAMSRIFPRTDAAPGTLSEIIVAPKAWVVDELPRVLDERTGRIEDIDWPLERDIRAHPRAARNGFDPDGPGGDRDVGHVAPNADVRPDDRPHEAVLPIVGIVTLALGGIGVMNIMLVAVKERTREIGVRKALGATTRSIQRQFFLEGFFLTMLSGGVGMLVALALCAAVNLAPMPIRFSGMVCHVAGRRDGPRRAAR